MSHKLALFLLIFIAPGFFLSAREQPAAAPVKAIVFDAFPILDQRPLDVLAKMLFLDQGAELMKVWRLRQFEYQWLRVAGGKYKDFEEVADDALVVAARQVHLELTAKDREAMMAQYRKLPAWPDAEAALTKLREKGYKVVFLSNMTERMLLSALEKSSLQARFDGVFSTDSQKTFKPSPAAYQIALDQLHLQRGEILFVASAGWDAAGAKWFGYPTFWVNRTGAAPEELDGKADGTGPDLPSLLEFLEGGRERVRVGGAVER